VFEKTKPGIDLMKATDRSPLQPPATSEHTQIFRVNK